MYLTDSRKALMPLLFGIPFLACSISHVTRRFYPLGVETMFVSGLRVGEDVNMVNTKRKVASENFWAKGRIAGYLINLLNAEVVYEPEPGDENIAGEGLIYDLHF